MTAKGHRGRDLSGPLRRKMWGREPQSDQGLAGRLRVGALSLCLRSTRRGPVDQGASQRLQTTPEAGAGPSAMRWPTGHTRESEGYGSSCQEAQGQATLPGAGPAPAPHSKAVYTETMECPPAPPVRPFSQELEMTWTTPEKRCVHSNDQAVSRSPSLYPASLGAPGTAASSSRAALLTLLVKD